jgi:hypothetical protein
MAHQRQFTLHSPPLTASKDGRQDRSHRRVVKGRILCSPACFHCSRYSPPPPEWFLLTAKRDTAAAKRFLRKAMDASGNPMPRVINVDKNPAYPAAVEALKADGTMPRRVALRQCKYLNNVIEQDHRTVKKRVWLAKGYGSFQSAWRTLQGIETVNMIRKGRVRWLVKGDAVGQRHFIGELFGLSA